MVKTNVKIYPKVVLEFDFKLSVAFLFMLSIYGEHMFEGLERGGGSGIL